MLYLRCLLQNNETKNYMNVAREISRGTYTPKGFMHFHIYISRIIVCNDDDDDDDDQ